MLNKMSLFIVTRGIGTYTCGRRNLGCWVRLVHTAIRMCVTENASHSILRYQWFFSGMEVKELLNFAYISLVSYRKVNEEYFLSQCIHSLRWTSLVFHTFSLFIVFWFDGNIENNYWFILFGILKSKTKVHYLSFLLKICEKKSYLLYW